MSNVEMNVVVDPKQVARNIEAQNQTKWQRFVTWFSESTLRQVIVFTAKTIRWLIAATLFALSALFIINGLVTKTTALYLQNPDFDTAAAFIITIILLIVLGFLEGLAVSVLTIQLANPKLFTHQLQNKYERAASVHALVSGNNSSKILSFVLGRQVLVTLIVFGVSQFTQFPLMKFFPWSDAPIPEGASIFVEQGIVSIILIATAGQLAPQIVAAAFPIQFSNLPFAWTLVKLSIIIDEVGLPYFSWLEARIIEKVLRLDRSINTKLQQSLKEAHEEVDVKITQSGMDEMDKFVVHDKRSPIRIIFDVIRYTWSTALVIFCAVFVLPGIVDKRSNFSVTFPGVPGWVCLVIFGVMLLFLWILEGGQVALVNLARIPDNAYRDRYPRAASTRKLVSNEFSMGAYLIGRQLWTVLIVFFAANLTGMSLTHYPGQPDWTISPTFNSIFLSSGLMGTIIVTLAGQLTPRLLCADFPIQTLNLPGLPLKIYICRIIEWIGIGHFSWILYYVFSFNLDTSVTDKLTSQRKGLSDEEETVNISKRDWTTIQKAIATHEEKISVLFERLNSARKAN